MDTFRQALSGHEKLSERMAFSRELLHKVRAAIAAHTFCTKPEVCVYAAGSLGRLEVGQISDLDVFLFADRNGKQPHERTLTRLEEISALSELIQVNTALKLPAFSGDGEFFKIHEVSQILSGTGTAVDDSENFFTTRLLLLLESKCLANDQLYDSATERVVEMYFRDGRGKSDYKPLFLLNDILRYWRTICLNYERTRNDRGRPWWKKNLNLKFSRKLTVFATVLAIMIDHVDTYEKFAKLSSLTPMERLATALDKLGEQGLLDKFQRFLDDYEEFLAAKSHAELEALDSKDAAHFRSTAQHFDDFLHETLASPRIEQRLRRFLLI
ncbi:MAG: hypothetical protein CBB60_003030 [Armatimonadetes bacterium Cent15-Ar3]|nr:MAG: hypothetical protein CBB60_003030 [Armatimonadetes bacterium Cent15-Ar3]